jgi:hypothetical protein
MRWLALLALVVGCSFSGTEGGDGDGDGDLEPDARVVDGIAADVTCPEHGDLLACYRFDLDTVDDAGDHDATVAAGSQTAFVPGADGAALAIQAASVIEVANSADFATDAITVELWLGPDFGQGFVFDLDKRFSVRVYGGGVVRCLIEAGGKRSAEAVLDTTRWNHVACTFDPGPGLQMFVNTTSVDFDGNTTPLDPGEPNPAHIGSDSPGGGGAFIGRLDNLRVWSRALEADQLCVECEAIGASF